MKLIKSLLAAVALAAMAGLALVAQQAISSGSAMVGTAQKFLGTLTPEQKQKATFPYDSKERTNWNFTPQQDNKTKTATRKGLPLEDMNADQKKAALALLRAGTSEAGSVAATTIMSLEAILRDTEKKGAMIRNPEWYFVTIFGEPSTTGKWGWRVEGHHLSLNFTMAGDQVVSSTPAFFGANPAEIKDGAKKGYRTLAPSEDLARQLFKSLDANQHKAALQEKQFGEPGEKTLTPKVGEPVGLAAAKMNAEQKEILTKLIKNYTERMPADVGAVEFKAATSGGLDGIHFAYSGSADLNQGRTYRVHGPTFIIEFLNMQPDGSGNAANHIHSCWRRLKGDFGL